MICTKEKIIMLAVLVFSVMVSAQAASVSIGKVYEFQSVNFATRGITHSINQLVYIRPNWPSRFKIVPGLAGSGISFICEDSHDYYLRHQGFIIKAHTDDGTDLFKKDATFLVLPGLNGGVDDVSFQSYNYRNRFIRHQNFQLKLHSGESKLFNKDDASWTPKEIPFLLVGFRYEFESVNYPRYMIRHLVNRLVKLEPQANGPTTFKVVSGLYNSSGISFQCDEDDNYYLRHQGFILKVHQNDNSELFKKDATFIPVYGLTNERTTVSLKSWNYPTHYIRHQNYQLKLHKKESSDLYKKDATWRPITIFG